MPKKTVVAGAWQIQTNAQAQGGFDSLDVTGVYPLDTKISTMERIVSEFYSDAESLAEGSGSPPLFIFVAPEYYFKRTLTQRFLTKEERDTVRNAMSGLAQSKRNLLLVPGTVTWRRPLDRDAYKKAKERLQGRIKMGHYPEKGIRVKDVPAPSLLRGTPKGDAAYNTAYLYLGTEIRKYHKMEDAAELLDEDDDAVFIPGDGKNVFKFAGLDIGVEICVDHASHHLKDWVDIHIVTSATVGRTDDYVMAKDGGLYIQADAGSAQITVVDRTAGVHLSPAAGGSTTPLQIGTEEELKAAGERRWKTHKQNNPNYFSKNPDKKPESKRFNKELVRLAYGGKLTTAMVEVDT
jgi:predicted amidohydrolase